MEILGFLHVTPKENGLLTLPDKSTLISHTFVKNYMKTSSLVVTIKYHMLDVADVKKEIDIN